MRYLGMNMPEFQEPLYLKAKRRNEDLVLHKTVELEYEQERVDGYNRVLAWIHVGDELVNLRLVKEGLAHVFIIPPNGSRVREMLQAQQEARARRLGIWRHMRGFLKITNVRTRERDADDPELHTEYVRLANVSEHLVHLKGYRLSNEVGRSYAFPDFDVEPGYTVLVVIGRGQDGPDARRQLRLYWDSPEPVWGKNEDTAYVEDPAGTLVDFFHYRGRRVSRRPRPQPRP